MLSALNRYSASVASHSSALLPLLSHQTLAKADTDFGGQRYVKPAEFSGLTEG